MAKRARLKSGYTLGGEEAESDTLLDEAFYFTSDYDVISSRTDHRRFIVGRTGSGKSALLHQLEEEFVDHVIRVNPEDLSLPYITDLQVIRYLDALEVNLDLFWIALWKHVLLVEILRHRYKIYSPEAKQTWMATLLQKFMKDESKTAAIKYLDEFEGSFWCEVDERVRHITDKFTRQLDGGAGLDVPGVPVSAKASASKAWSGEVRTESAARFQRIVNRTQLAKLNTMIKMLKEDILDEQNFTYIIVDDLDKDWVDDRVANDLIRCLFRAAVDLQRVTNLKVLVALRTNIFQELDFGRKGAGQEEKYRSKVKEMVWSKRDLEALLDQRAQLIEPSAGLNIERFADVLPNPNRTRDPMDYIMERTLFRPRDAIAFANACLAQGAGRTRLGWEQVKAAEKGYSTNRLLALRDEWKGTYPGIDRVLEAFRGCDNRMDRPEFQRRLDDVMILISEPDFEGVTWLTNISENMWNSVLGVTWFDLYQPLLSLLYFLGLIGCSSGQTSSPTFFNDDALLLESELAVERLDHFYVHRMFHVALDIRQSSRW